MPKSAFALLIWESLFIRIHIVMYNATMAKTGGYQMNEKDIESVIKFLKITDPENATPEVAILILERLQATFHTMSHEDPEKLKEIYESLKKEKKLKVN